MNRFDNPADDDLRFDLLVDGELSDAERRQLLAALDEEPGGWRRCAMAFLESQAWRQSMREVQHRGDVSGASPSLPVSQPPERTTPSDSAGGGRSDSNKTRRTGAWRLVMAMAACFLVAFLLGTEVRQRWWPAPQSTAPLAQRRSSDTEGAAINEAPPEVQVELPPSEAIPWGAATFVMDDDERREVKVPVFDLDPYERQMLLENSTAALDNLRQQLQQNGFDVQRRVSWSPVEIGGGQQMVVPVGDFEISLASNRTAQ